MFARGENHEICWIVIEPVSVLVMDNFVGVQESPEVFFHRDPVRKNHALGISARMIRNRHDQVALIRNR